jgi:hypothetical protein
VARRRGTLQKLAQDDKGFFALVAVGAPPFAPHASDPARGALAALDAHAALAAAGVRAGIGVTTGPIYSGVVRCPPRRERGGERENAEN